MMGQFLILMVSVTLFAHSLSCELTVCCACVADSLLPFTDKRCVLHCLLQVLLDKLWWVWCCVWARGRQANAEMRARAHVLLRVCMQWRAHSLQPVSCSIWRAALHLADWSCVLFVSTLA